MKKTLLLLVIVFTVLACKKKQQPLSLVKDLDYDKAESFVFKHNDSAFYYFNKVVTNAKDSMQVAMAYNYMAVIQSDAGDYFGAQESLLASLKFLDETNPEDFACLSSDYNELGANSSHLKNYDAAITYYDAAIRFAKNKDFKLIISNNKALVYRNKKDYPKAIKIYHEIISKNEKNKIEYARKLTNLSFTKWLQDPGYPAESELLEALNIREKAGSDWGRNSSYAHLSDYYTARQPALALHYAKKMHQVARKLNSPDDQLEALRKLIRLSPPAQTKNYFDGYETLADSLQTARNAAKNQFALVRYESEKTKADNLKLQQENDEKKHQIVVRELLLLSTLLLLIPGSAIAVLWYKKRKQKMESEARTALRDSQLNTSKRVHDVVANGLYRVMTEIENQDDIDKAYILDKIDDLYEKSRDISYEQAEATERNFQEKISALLRSFATENTKILIAGNTVDLWGKVNPNVRYEIEHILQELMINMKKHSSASNVGIKFEKRQDQVHIQYTDNGIGMSAETRFKNGLRNTGNRIDGIRGEITFDTKMVKGLKIQISFPVS